MKKKLNEIEDIFKNYTWDSCLLLVQAVNCLETEEEVPEIDDGKLIANMIVYLGIFVLEASQKKYGDKKAELIFDKYISNSLKHLKISDQTGLEKLNDYMVERNVIYTNLINKFASHYDKGGSILENPVAALGKAFSDEVINKCNNNAWIYISVSTCLSGLITGTYELINNTKIKF